MRQVSLDLTQPEMSAKYPIESTRYPAQPSPVGREYRAPGKGRSASDRVTLIAGYRSSISGIPDWHLWDTCSVARRYGAQMIGEQRREVILGCHGEPSELVLWAMPTGTGSSLRWDGTVTNPTFAR